MQTVWQAGTTYSYAVYPDANILFSDVTLLIIPTCIKSESATEMMYMYGNVVRSRFTKIDENEEWILYRKIK